MVLDWLSGGRSHDVADLIARKKYSKAIEVMRAQFEDRPPGVETRLQFVDVLILAGRNKEAVPVLLGLADEYAADGQIPKAIATLKRIESIEPDRRDVDDKLAALIRKDYDATGAKPGRPGRPGPRDWKPFVPDMEEIAIAPVPADRPALPPPAPEPAPEPTPETASTEPAPSAEPTLEPEAGTGTDELSPPVVETPEAPPITAEAPTSPEPELHATTASSDLEPLAMTVASATADTSVTRRIRGAFRKFLSSLPGTDESSAELAAASVEPEPLPLTTDEAAPMLSISPDLEIEPDSDVAIEPEVEAAGDEGGEAAILEEDLSAPPLAETDAEVFVETNEDTRPPAIEAPTQATDLFVPEGFAPTVEAEAPLTIEPATPEIAVGVEPVAEAPAVVEREAEASGVAGVEPRAESALPLSVEPAAAEPEEAPPQPTTESEPAMTEEAFHGQVLDLIEELVQQPKPAPAPAEAADAPRAEAAPVRTRGVAWSAKRLAASPLFDHLSEPELLSVVRGMRLHTYEAGDIVLTEGEPGDSLFVITTGSVRIFVKNPAGHNFEMGMLKEGEFFGEISSLSGRPRTGTVVAAEHTELLELHKKEVDKAAHQHPRVRETLENFYLKRASSPEAAAIRAVPVDPASRQRSIEVLEAYFGESRWDPRMRLRLADLLVKAGKEDEAVPLLVGLADDLDRAGYPDKAIAILKKIERIRKRNIEEVNLAPLAGKKAKSKPAPTQPPGAPKAISKPATTAAGAEAHPGVQVTREQFSHWILDVVRDAVAPPTTTEAVPPTVAPGYARGLVATPLFEGLSEDELYAVIRELRLLSFDPGDVILTEGEHGQSIFILTAGAVKVSVRDVNGRNTPVTELRAGSFFGEMASVSGKPRTATVTAAQGCELLELDKSALDSLSERHPRVRETIEEIYIARAEGALAARQRPR